MSETEPVKFPCRAVGDPAEAKLVGLHAQRQDQRWMQRIKVVGGVLSAGQWRALGDAARLLTPSAPLHLTTRQDIEFHDLPTALVPFMQTSLAEAGLTAVGAGGDTPRNVTVCPCSGMARDSVDLVPLACEIRRTFAEIKGIFSLPRKFKVSLSCGPACGEPYVNDVALVATRRRGRWGFAVIAGGSLGSKPATGIVVRDWLAARHALPFVVACVEVFAAHGDREHRNRARLRHVRERVGDEAFRVLVGEAFERVLTERDWPDVTLSSAVETFPAAMRLTFPNGDVTAQAAEALGDLAEREDLRVRITNHHEVAVFGPADEVLQDAVGASDVLARAAERQAHVVACPGTRWCKRALADTNGLADGIRRRLGADSSPATTICISGCPNGCAHSRVARVGLVGGVSGRGDERHEAYDLFVGGAMGRGPDLSSPVALGIPADVAAERVVRALRELDAGPAGASGGG